MRLVNSDERNNERLIMQGVAVKMRQDTEAQWIIVFSYFQWCAFAVRLFAIFFVPLNEKEQKYALFWQEK